MEDPNEFIIVQEPKVLWGGDWTEQKLDAFEKYVKAYLTILNTYKHKNGWETIYFDGFAGSGNRSKDIEPIDESQLFDSKDIEITPEEYNVYRGAAERVLNIKDNEGFDYYYFNEPHQESLTSLKEKLEPFVKEGKKIIYRDEDANVELSKLAVAFAANNKYRGLILLDPFGMQINWKSIEKLKGLNVDIWILIPTGVIINRLLKRDGELLLPEKLETFFGIPQVEIKKFFYHTKIANTLFGEELVINKIPNSIKKIAELYIKRLKNIFPYVTEQPLVLNNSLNLPIFHFAFASRNKNAVKIAKDIIGKS